MPQFRVLVTGSLGFGDYALLCSTLDQLLGDRESVEIVTGGATGTESLAQRYAHERGLGVKQLVADWKLYGAARR